MKKFIFNLIYIIGIFILFVFGSLYLISGEKYVGSLNYAILDKHLLLEKTKNINRRIILLGGSNVSYGFYSPYIESDFKMPVINMGIHAGYGLKYIIDDIKPFVKHGDIVILSPEYSHFYGTIFHGEADILQSLDAIPSNIKHISIKQFFMHLPEVPNMAFGKFKKFIKYITKGSKLEDTDYMRTSFNCNGDEVFHWKNKLNDFKLASIIQLLPKDYNKETMKYIISFNKFLNKKGVNLFITPPTLNYTQFKKNQVEILRIHNEFKKNKFLILGNPKDVSYPDNMYHDSNYHLNEMGQKIRTNYIIDYLSRFIKR